MPCTFALLLTLILLCTTWLSYFLTKISLKLLFKNPIAYQIYLYNYIFIFLKLWKGLYGHCLLLKPFMKIYICIIIKIKSNHIKAIKILYRKIYMLEIPYALQLMHAKILSIQFESAIFKFFFQLWMKSAFIVK